MDMLPPPNFLPLPDSQEQQFSSFLYVDNSLLLVGNLTSRWMETEPAVEVHKLTCVTQ